MEYEIFFSDLTPEAQRGLLEFLGIPAPEDANLDTFPLVSVPKEG